jgi:hypothetical protein
MKCRVKREFVGRVKELSNGSRQAQGTCPVCGTTIVRMVSRTTPLDEWDEDAPPAPIDRLHRPSPPISRTLRLTPRLPRRSKRQLPKRRR